MINNNEKVPASGEMVPGLETRWITEEDLTPEERKRFEEAFNRSSSKGSEGIFFKPSSGTNLDIEGDSGSVEGLEVTEGISPEAFQEHFSEITNKMARGI
ncbi:MAG: hypothetical protein QG614_30 [Patescibacteria group bacterium]|nr:hypothetical protein [Patescibacteria group bacterium]